MNDNAIQRVSGRTQLEMRIGERISPVLSAPERDACCLCTASMKVDNVTANLIGVSYPNGNRCIDILYGPVCRACVAAGPTGAAERIEAIAREMTESAKEIAAMPPEHWDGIEAFDRRVAARRAKDVAQKSVSADSVLSG